MLVQGTAVPCYTLGRRTQEMRVWGYKGEDFRGDRLPQGAHKEMQKKERPAPSRAATTELEQRNLMHQVRQTAA